MNYLEIAEYMRPNIEREKLKIDSPPQAQDKEETVVDSLIEENDKLKEKVEDLKEEKTKLIEENKSNTETYNYHKSSDSYTEERQKVKKYTR